MTARRTSGDPAASAVREVLDGFRRIVQALRSSSTASEKRTGLSGAQLFVLRMVAETPGLSLNDLAERTRTHQSSVSAVVSRLVRLGLVERTAAMDDARRAELRQTAAGRRRLAHAPQAAQERLAAAVERLGPADRARLASLLGQIAAGMALPRGRPSMFFEDGDRRPTRRVPAQPRASRGPARSGRQPR
jgi:DNA-binding MarR family transcriptional regulator